MQKIQKRIPNDWELEKLGNLVSIKTGKLNSNAAVENGRYPFFTCSQEDFRTNTYSFDTECVLLGGNNAVGVYPLKHYEGKFDVYQRTYVLESLDVSKLLTKYLFYNLSPKLRLFKRLSTGATTKFLTLRVIQNVKIELPPIIIQEKIISYLNNLENLVNNTQSIINHLLILKKGLMQHLFTEGIGYTEFKETRLGRIPKEWAIVRLIDVANINPNYEVPEQENFLFLEMESVDEVNFRPKYWLRREREKLTNTKFKNGDTLFAKITPCLENGKGAYIQDLNEAIAFGSTELVVLSPKNKIHPLWLFYLTKSTNFRNKAISLMEGATGRQRVPKHFFKSYKVKLPNFEEQVRISEILLNIDLKIEKEKSCIMEIKKVKKGLMQDLLTGKKRIKIN